MAERLSSLGCGRRPRRRARLVLSVGRDAQGCDGRGGLWPRCIEATLWQRCKPHGIAQETEHANQERGRLIRLVQCRGGADHVKSGGAKTEAQWRLVWRAAPLSLWPGGALPVAFNGGLVTAATTVRCPLRFNTSIHVACRCLLLLLGPGRLPCAAQ